VGRGYPSSLGEGSGQEARPLPRKMNYALEMAFRCILSQKNAEFPPKVAIG